MDEIQERLQETSKNCLDAYGEWASNRKNTQAQEKLHTAIHELRKVSSRLEIELAISERDEISSKPLPIPPHRSVRGNKPSQGEDEDDGYGNKVTDEGDSKPRRSHKPLGKHMGPKKTISIEPKGE